MKKKLVTAIAAAMIFTLLPAVPAAAEEVATVASTEDTQAVDQTAGATDAEEVSTAASEQNEAVEEKTYTPVNARKLTSSYKSQLKKKRKSKISVKKTSYKSRTAFEGKSLIGLSWDEFKELSQIGISKKDFDLMCRVVSAEAGDTASYKAKELTAECIVNRARGYKGSGRVTKALKAKGQFSVVRNGAINRVTINGETVNACKDALIRNSHPKSLYYFSAGRYFSWAKPYMKVNGTYFCLKK
ncbi:MAG: cell wall hydrolase [Lachnospiraceae bacterium]|nr:cell wall hydrolase [Lachnospiraceae bacterium]